MPEFSVGGTNYIWFDPAKGQVVRSTMDLRFLLELGPQLGVVTNLLSMYGELLRDIEGGGPTAPDATPQGPLMDLDLRIDGTMELVE